MTLQLLIDECLSPELVRVAVAAGYPNSTCSRDRGLLGAPDWHLVRLVIEGDYTLVTHNSRDFRGPNPAAAGGLYAQQPIHAGLICLNSVHAMDLERQLDLLGIALARLATMEDLVNTVLEVSEDADESVRVVVYQLPAGP